MTPRPPAPSRFAPRARRFAPARRRTTIAWLASVALAAGGAMALPQAVAAPPVTSAGTINYNNNPYTTTTIGSGFDLNDPWLEAGASASGAHGRLWAGGVNYDSGSEGAFVGLWNPNPTTGLVETATANVATTYQVLPDDLSSRAVAIDGQRGPVLYAWSSDSADYWQSAEMHPAEFAPDLLGTDPATGKSCAPTTWGSAHHGSWTAVRAYPAGQTAGTVLWVPNPRAGDVMSAYNAQHPYHGTYDTARDPAWPCVNANGQSDDGWAAGHVIPSTSQIFFVSRGSLATTFRAMVFDPATGAVAQSGPLRPAGPDDDLFGGANAMIVPGVAVDATGNAYVLARGQAPAGSPWSDPSAPGAWAVYLVRITPTPNPQYDPAAAGSDPATLPYLHNGRWTYNIVQKLSPAPGASADVGNVFQAAACADWTCVSTQNLTGLAWLNGQLYTADAKYLYRIDAATGQAVVVPGGSLSEGGVGIAGSGMSSLSGSAGSSSEVIVSADYPADYNVSITSLAAVAGDPPPVQTLEVAPGEGSVTAEGGQAAFTVTASKDWTLNGLPAWIHASAMVGSAGTSQVTLTVDAWSGSAPRQAIVTISSPGQAATYTLDQAAAPATSWWSQWVAQFRALIARLLSLFSGILATLGH